MLSDDGIDETFFVPTTLSPEVCLVFNRDEHATNAFKEARRKTIEMILDNFNVAKGS
jgi:hypothetical protein